MAAGWTRGHKGLQAPPPDVNARTPSTPRTRQGRRRGGGGGVEKVMAESRRARRRASTCGAPECRSTRWASRSRRGLENQASVELSGHEVPRQADDANAKANTEPTSDKDPHAWGELSRRRGQRPARHRQRRRTDRRGLQEGAEGAAEGEGRAEGEEGARGLRRRRRVGVAPARARAALRVRRRRRAVRRGGPPPPLAASARRP